MALIHIGFFSEALGMCVNCDVVLPQTASGQIGMAAQARDGRHPTLWLLHGASDDHTVWQRRTSIERYAAPLGLAVVMPAVQLSSYANMAHGGRFYDYVADELPKKTRDAFAKAWEKTKDNDGMTLVVAVNYGGRVEMLDAMRSLMDEAHAAVRAGRAPEELTEESFARHLYTADIPDPDLLIRTSGEMRVSNFLLWQIAYSEFVCTDVLWPDFDRYELLRALLEFQGRDRRFGAVK